jgi:hypothetical protein
MNFFLFLDLVLARFCGEFLNNPKKKKEEKGKEKVGKGIDTGSFLCVCESRGS